MQIWISSFSWKSRCADHSGPTYIPANQQVAGGEDTLSQMASILTTLFLSVCKQNAVYIYYLFF